MRVPRILHSIFALCAIVWSRVGCVQDDGELRLQRILRALKSIADLLPQPASGGAAAALSPPRQEELAAAASFRRAVLRMFGAHDKVRCHLSGPHECMKILSAHHKVRCHLSGPQKCMEIPSPPTPMFAAISTDAVDAAAYGFSACSGTCHQPSTGRPDAGGGQPRQEHASARQHWGGS